MQIENPLQEHDAECLIHGRMNVEQVLSNLLKEMFLLILFKIFIC